VDGGELQDPQILHVGALAMRGLQGIEGASKRHRGKQILAIAIARKRTGLPHQPANDMAVVDPVLVLASQARHGLHQLPAVADLDDIGMHAGFDRMAHQPRRHGIGPVRDANRAPPADDGQIDRVAGNGGRGQRVKRGAIRGDALGDRATPPIDDVAYERFVRR
jgi:hypothetical protein